MMQLSDQASDRQTNGVPYPYSSDTPMQARQSSDPPSSDRQTNGIPYPYGEGPRKQMRQSREYDSKDGMAAVYGYPYAPTTKRPAKDAGQIFTDGIRNLMEDPVGWFFGSPSPLYSNGPALPYGYRKGRQARGGAAARGNVPYATYATSTTDVGDISWGPQASGYRQVDGAARLAGGAATLGNNVPPVSATSVGDISWGDYRETYPQSEARRTGRLSDYVDSDPSRERARMPWEVGRDQRGGVREREMRMPWQEGRDQREPPREVRMPWREEREHREYEARREARDGREPEYARERAVRSGWREDFPEPPLSRERGPRPERQEPLYYREPSRDPPPHRGAEWRVPPPRAPPAARGADEAAQREYRERRQQRAARGEGAGSDDWRGLRGFHESVLRGDRTSALWRSINGAPPPQQMHARQAYGSPLVNLPRAVSPGTQDRRDLGSVARMTHGIAGGVTQQGTSSPYPQRAGTPYQQPYPVRVATARASGDYRDPYAARERASMADWEGRMLPYQIPSRATTPTPTPVADMTRGRYSGDPYRSR